MGCAKDTEAKHLGHFERLNPATPITSSARSVFPNADLGSAPRASGSWQHSALAPALSQRRRECMRRTHRRDADLRCTGDSFTQGADSAHAASRSEATCRSGEVGRLSLPASREFLFLHAETISFRQARESFNLGRAVCPCNLCLRAFERPFEYLLGDEIKAPSSGKVLS